jgi:hypothetical protein
MRPLREASPPRLFCNSRIFYYNGLRCSDNVVEMIPAELEQRPVGAAFLRRFQPRRGDVASLFCRTEPTEITRIGRKEGRLQSRE